jgi:phospholipase D1/2
MLQAAAARGVRVNVIVYKEVTQALTRKFLTPHVAPYPSSLMPRSSPYDLETIYSLVSDAIPSIFSLFEGLEAKYPHTFRCTCS